MFCHTIICVSHKVSCAFNDSSKPRVHLLLCVALMSPNLSEYKANYPQPFSFTSFYFSDTEHPLTFSLKKYARRGHHVLRMDAMLVASAAEFTARGAIHCLWGGAIMTSINHKLFRGTTVVNIPIAMFYCCTARESLPVVPEEHEWQRGPFR